MGVGPGAVHIHFRFPNSPRMVDTVPWDSTGNVSVDVVTRKSRTSISPRTPDDLTSSQASSVWWVSLSGDLDEGEISVDSVKFRGVFFSGEHCYISCSQACKMVPFSPSRVLNSWGDMEPRSKIVAFHMMSDRNSVVKLSLVF